MTDKNSKHSDLVQYLNYKILCQGKKFKKSPIKKILQKKVKLLDKQSNKFSQPSQKNQKDKIKQIFENHRKKKLSSQRSMSLLNLKKQEYQSNKSEQPLVQRNYQGYLQGNLLEIRQTGQIVNRVDYSQSELKQQSSYKSQYQKRRKSLTPDVKL